MQKNLSPAPSAGAPFINTLGAPGGMAGPTPCGTGGAPGVASGQQCVDIMFAAGSPLIKTFFEQVAGTINPPWFVGSLLLNAAFDIFTDSVFDDL
jgi:hypothetical protein